MLANTLELLKNAQKGGYALGAFNIYNMEGLTAVIQAAESLNSPVMVQLHPITIEWNEGRIIPACIEAAKESTVPVSIHLDHSQSVAAIDIALQKGMNSVMADGSDLSFEDNLKFTKSIVDKAMQFGAIVEGEFGKLAGEEDGLSVEAYEAKMTNPDLAAAYVQETGVSSLAVCIGNVHGKYAHDPNLDFERLKTIRNNVDVPLVLHGASGVPASMVRESIALGVCKFNVNTEIRAAYIDAVRDVMTNSKKPDVMPIIQHVVEKMTEVISQKILLFKSDGKA